MEFEKELGYSLGKETGGRKLKALIDPEGFSVRFPFSLTGRKNVAMLDSRKERFFEEKSSPSGQRGKNHRAQDRAHIPFGEERGKERCRNSK